MKVSSPPSRTRTLAFQPRSSSQRTAWSIFGLIDSALTPFRGKTWTLIDCKPATSAEKSGSSLAAAAMKCSIPPARFTSTLNWSRGKRFSSSSGTNPGGGGCARPAEAARKRARAMPGMSEILSFRMLDSLRVLLAPSAGGLLRRRVKRNSERVGNAVGGADHNAAAEHVVAHVEAGPPAHLAEIGQGVARLLRRAGDLRGAGLPRLLLGADEEDTAPKGQGEQGRRRGDAEGQHGAAGTGRRTEGQYLGGLGALPAHPLHDLRRAVVLRQRSQLGLNSLGQRQLCGARGGDLHT